MLHISLVKESRGKARVRGATQNVVATKKYCVVNWSRRNCGASAAFPVARKRERRSSRARRERPS